MASGAQKKYANNIVTEKEYTQFNIENIEMFNDKFIYYREKEIIKNMNFSDATWIVENKYEKHGYFSTISFNLNGSISKYNLIIKCLFLSKMGEETGNPEPETLIIRYKYLIGIIEITKGFNPRNLKIFDEYIEEISQKTSVIHRLVSALNDLEVFYEDDYITDFYDDYFEIIGRYVDPAAFERARKIPHFKSLIRFNLILKQAFPTLSREEKKRFYPLYLWWNITMIVPMRPSEFLKLKYDCCWKDEGGRYWITVPRSKVEDKNSQIKLVYELEINETTYEMIQDYKDFLSEEFSANEYLMPHEVYKSCFSNLSIGNSNKHRIDKEKLNPNDGNGLLKQFYNKYINMDCNSKIEMLRMGDTRHYAFCNMILQGLNGLTIAQIGGHTSLSSQIHYYQQLNICADAYVSELSDRLYQLREYKYSNSSNFMNKEYKSRTYLSLINQKNRDEMLEIEYGFCTNKFKNDANLNFDKCSEDCYECDFHILDLERFPHVRKELQERSSRLEKVIKEQIETLKSISKDILIDYGKENVDFSSDRKLRSIGSELKDVMDRKAKIDSYLLDYIIMEGTDNDK